MADGSSIHAHPCSIGAGQLSHRVDQGAEVLEPVDLMVEALRGAEADSGAYRGPGPGRLGARRLPALVALRATRAPWWPSGSGATPPDRVHGHGRQLRATVVNHTAADIQAGRADIVLVTGAEAWRVADLRHGPAGTDLGWTTPAERIGAHGHAGRRRPRLSAPGEIARGVFMPVQVYPMFEIALRAKAGLTVDEHRQRVGALWSRFSEVAATQPQRLDPAGLHRRGDRHRHAGQPHDRLSRTRSG